MIQAVPNKRQPGDSIRTTKQTRNELSDIILLFQLLNTNQCVGSHETDIDENDYHFVFVVSVVIIACQSYIL